MRALPPALAAVALACGLGVAPLAAQPSSYEALTSLTSLLNHVRLNYVDSVSYAELVPGAMEGVLRSLDPHSRLVTRAEEAKQEALALGTLGVAGIQLEQVRGRFVLLSVAEDGAGAAAGLSAGDRLLSVQGLPLEGLPLHRAQLRLAGEPGSELTLEVERGTWLDPTRFSVEVTLSRPTRTSVGSAALLPGRIGYVRLLEFGEHAADELKERIGALRRADIDGLLLDLRENPGGRVDAAVDVAGLFLPSKAPVLEMVGRRAAANRTMATTGNGPFRDLPLILLVDRGSASASEALAAALQDHDRALVVGERTFGKALAQAPFALSSGDVVWLTVARISSPSGRIIQRPHESLTAEAYFSLAGSGDESELPAYRTGAGRVVRGGGGVTPDIQLPSRPPLPPWWTMASGAGTVLALTDSVAQSLPADDVARDAWQEDTTAWAATLLAPLLARVEEQIGEPPAVSTELAPRLARALAVRAALVRWGPEAADLLRLTSDPDVRAAAELLPDLPRLLAAPPASSGLERDAGR